MPFPLAFNLRHYPVVVWAMLVSGIGGAFHYGYSISVMNSPSEFIKDMINETCETRYNATSDQCPVSVLWSVTVSIFSLGGMLGSMMVGSLVSRLGRKKTLLLNCFVAIAGAVLMILSRTAKSFEMIIVGRVLYGINAGIGVSAHTLYVTECAPKRLKQVAGVTAATFTCVGRFFGQMLGLREILGTDAYWPFLLGFNGLTALIQLVTLPFLPESPNFLLLDKGDRPACDKALKKLWGNRDHNMVMDKMQEEKAALEAVRSHSVVELFQDGRVRKELVTLFVTFISLQLCGVVAVYFYSFEVFRSAGLKESMFPYAALGMGGCEMLSSFICLLFCMGTKVLTLLKKGYATMCFALGLLICTLLIQRHITWMAYVSMVLIYIHVGSCAMGPGAMTGPLPGQMFTYTFKSAAFTLGYVLSWSTLFMVGMSFPYLVETINYSAFGVFLAFSMFCWLYLECNSSAIDHFNELEINADVQMRRINLPIASVENSIIENSTDENSSEGNNQAGDGPDDNGVQVTHF